jgi:membrane-associated phospholipid phosphatase
VLGQPRNSGVGTLSPEQRRRKAFEIRREAAQFHRAQDLPLAATNGDEQLPGHIGSFSKTLAHSNLGEVDGTAYNAYVHALTTGNPQDFEAIPMGGPGKLSNPQSSYSWSMEGPDAQQVNLAPPPSLLSARTAGEMVEDYWMALTRDVPFAQYGTSPLIQQAGSDLSRLSDFRGPKVNGSVAPVNMFRGPWNGEFTGPYLSQFLTLPIPYGMITIDQKYQSTAPNIDFVTSYNEWLSIQRGNPPSQKLTFTSAKYISTGRDLASYVHSDFSYQSILNAALILLSFGAAGLNKQNPYTSYKTQSSFVTFGGPNVLDAVARVSCAALKATWNQKWLLHRRLRPEVYAGRVHNHITGAAQYPLHSDVLNSSAVQAVYSSHGTYLLPIAYPEGSPTHPSYPAGHAALVGAGVTILKAFFDGNATIPSPMVAAADGSSLTPYTGEPLTIAGELNKLASNIALGRDTAGVHYRSDGVDGMLLGEAVALGTLRDLTGCYTEQFTGLTITRFDGTQVSFCDGCVV